MSATVQPANVCSWREATVRTFRVESANRIGGVLSQRRDNVRIAWRKGTRVSYSTRLRPRTEHACRRGADVVTGMGVRTEGQECMQRHEGRRGLADEGSGRRSRGTWRYRVTALIRIMVHLVASFIRASAHSRASFTRPRAGTAANISGTDTSLPFPRDALRGGAIFAVSYCEHGRQSVPDNWQRNRAYGPTPRLRDLALEGHVAFDPAPNQLAALGVRLTAERSGDASLSIA